LLKAALFPIAAVFLLTLEIGIHDYHSCRQNNVCVQQVPCCTSHSINFCLMKLRQYRIEDLAPPSEDSFSFLESNIEPLRLIDDWLAGNVNVLLKLKCRIAGPINLKMPSSLKLTPGRDSSGLCSDKPSQKEHLSNNFCFGFHLPLKSNLHLTSSFCCHMLRACEN